MKFNNIEIDFHAARANRGSRLRRSGPDGLRRRFARHCRAASGILGPSGARSRSSGVTSGAPNQRQRHAGG